jgi:hypothetical protein
MEPELLDTVTTSEAARLLSIADRTLRRRLARAQLKPAITGRTPGEENRHDRAAILALAPYGEPQLQQPPPADLAAIQSALMSVMADLSGRSTEMAGLVRQMADNQMATPASLSDIVDCLTRIEELTAPPAKPEETLGEAIAPAPRYW